MSPHSIGSRAHQTSAYLEALGYGKRPGESSDYQTAVEALEPRERVLVIAWLGLHGDPSGKANSSARAHASRSGHLPSECAANF